jgi:type II secretory pathway predicted ATPase ExeA
MAAPRTQFYHPAKLIDGALHGVDRAIRRAEGFSLVVGSPGTGKSLLLAKVAESVGDDFAVALLSGARICTRRALWQSILAELGQPYRGIDEAELRIAVVETVRGLAARGSGLVILVDEAHTLPLRLIEELRLLANTPTPLPAVHIVLAGTSSLEERLGAPKMESCTQRIAMRAYLEPLDHAETVAYLRTQMKAAGLDWDAAFDRGCDDAVYGAADGVPRLVNQICDQALVLVGEGRRVRPADIAAAWQEIQRLPAPGSLGAMAADEAAAVVGPAAADRAPGMDFGDAAPLSTIEFGSLDEEVFTRFDDAVEGVPVAGPAASRQADDGFRGNVDPWHGPDVEFVFDADADPFQEFFEQEERIVDRYLVRSGDGFGGQPRVSSREGEAIVRELMELEGERATKAGRELAGGRGRDGGVGARETAAASAGGTTTSENAEAAACDDADMVVIEEDMLVPASAQPSIAAVRLGDYRRLFARLRRGG